MTRQTWKVASLLFFSGLCALIYQTVWLRQFRMIFGASTYATGAVLAIFMAGLGIGSAILGKRADARERPLRFYAHLELLISIAAALSPLLLWLAGKVYFSSGGSPALGLFGATVLRLVLSLLVLGPATLLMGGTLPAAARAIETNDDSGRRAVALLYGVNTLGAVAGALLSTFVLLETFGNRATLLMAVLVNVIVGLTARSMKLAATDQVPDRPEAGETPAPLSQRYVYAASAIVGFAFLLMELVWYRMLSPILGGTTYMFGLILAIALAGIGTGGASYALLRRRGATAGVFAITCSLEALAIAIPFALGDRLALFANVLRDLGVTGFGGYVLGWTIVTLIVVFPAAFVAGVQFPLLIALLGEGRENVGRQIGGAYAWNTAGAIVGSLAGGFGIIPMLSAPGTWRAVALILAALAIVVAFVAFRANQRTFATVTVGATLLAIASTFALGPTALWRHSSIGAGRSARPKSHNELLEWIHRARRVVVWDRDGRESSVGLLADTDLAFIINGKSDGAAVGDAGTQVMLGIAGAALHAKPASSLVVGLGTGSTAGWLAAIPTMQRVDVVELEPVVIDVARACREVNANALANPKLHVTIGDAREVLLTSDRRYDLIASEPSNPYRAGIASLFTRDFYEAASQRLERGGYFLQWLQMYGIDTATLQTVYATITTVFPNVQTWQTTEGDLMLIASREPVVFDVDALRARLASEPYRTATWRAWNVDSAEGFFSHLVANESFARAAASEAAVINTDDRTVIEFGFARSLHDSANMPKHIANAARAAGVDRPLAMRGAIDWKRVVAMRSQPPVRPTSPVDVEFARAESFLKQQQPDEAAAAIVRALDAYRRMPWARQDVVIQGMKRVVQVGQSSPARARVIADALSQPFAAMQYENFRRNTLVTLTPRFDGCGKRTIAALRAVEPNPFWGREELTTRAVCYARAGLSELAERAARDLEEYNASEPSAVIKARR